MLSLLISFFVGVGLFAVTYWPADFGIGWSVAIGIVGFASSQAAIGLFVRKRVTRDMASVQAILENGQKRIQAKVQRWQFRPSGSPQSMQREMFEDTKVFVREALAAADVLLKYRLWVPMIERQRATAKLQLNWMIKDFKAVDEWMPKALLLDPSMVAMKMARMYMLDAKTEEIGKVYSKAVRRLRYNQNVLLAATWSWILVKRGDSDGAFKALSNALHNSDNETLKLNHEALMNNRVSHFNNSGIGDSWYMLYLEEPKIRTQRQRPVYR